MRFVVFVALKEFYIRSFRCSYVSLLDVPLAIIKDGLVLDVSKEAARWGVCTGIPKALARRRCPDLICEDFNPDVCAELYMQVWSLFAEKTPQVEPLSFHEGFLDLTGCVPRNVSIEKVMNALLWRLQFETGLEATWGGGQDKWIARLARDRKRWIAPNEEERFLDHVPLQQLEIPPSLQERLERYGIISVGNLLRTPRSFLQSHLQLTAQDLQPLYFRDCSAVLSTFPPPLLQAEATLQWDNDDELFHAIQSVAFAAEDRLRACHQQSGKVRIVLRAGSVEHISVVTLAKPVHTAAGLRSILHRTIEAEQPRDLRRIKLTLENLTPSAPTQAELWQNSSRGTSAQIEKARRILERKYGHQTVQNGRDYQNQVPPRFAQLIYARKGIYLP